MPYSLSIDPSNPIYLRKRHLPSRIFGKYGSENPQWRIMAFNTWHMGIGVRIPRFPPDISNELPRDFPHEEIEKRFPMKQKIKDILNRKREHKLEYSSMRLLRRWRKVEGQPRVTMFIVANNCGEETFNSWMSALCE